MKNIPVLIIKREEKMPERGAVGDMYNDSARLWKTPKPQYFIVNLRLKH